MKRATLILSALSLLAACNTITEKKTGTEDMVHYNSLITNVIVSHCLEEGRKYDPHMPYYSMLSDTTEILKIRKEAYDPLLGVKMRRHDLPGQFSAGGHIIYVADKNGFEYAFSFSRSSYYNYLGEDSKIENGDLATHFDNPDMESNRARQDDSRTLLDNNILYTSYKLNLKGIDSAERFVHLFADSLMGLKELHEKDTLFIQQAITKQLKQDSLYKRSNDWYTYIMKQKIWRIVRILKSHNPLIHYYYVPDRGTQVFWEFTVFNDDTEHETHKKLAHPVYSVSVHIINGEFHVPVYF